MKSGIVTDNADHSCHSYRIQVTDKFKFALTKTKVSTGTQVVQFEVSAHFGRGVLLTQRGRSVC